MLLLELLSVILIQLIYDQCQLAIYIVVKSLFKQMYNYKWQNYIITVYIDIRLIVLLKVLLSCKNVREEVTDMLKWHAIIAVE